MQIEFFSGLTLAFLALEQVREKERKKPNRETHFDAEHMKERLKKKKNKIEKRRGKHISIKNFNVISIDIDCQPLTAGPEGLTCGINQRHHPQQIPTGQTSSSSLQVHAFDFGEECPVVQLKTYVIGYPSPTSNDED